MKSDTHIVDWFSYMKVTKYVSININVNCFCWILINWFDISILLFMIMQHIFEKGFKNLEF